MNTTTTINSPLINFSTSENSINFSVTINIGENSFNFKINAEIQSLLTNNAPKNTLVLTSKNIRYIDGPNDYDLFKIRGLIADFFNQEDLGNFIKSDSPIAPELIQELCNQFIATTPQITWSHEPRLPDYFHELTRKPIEWGDILKTHEYKPGKAELLGKFSSPNGEYNLIAVNMQNESGKTYRYLADFEKNTMEVLSHPNGYREITHLTADQVDTFASSVMREINGTQLELTMMMKLARIDARFGVYIPGTQPEKRVKIDFS